MKRILNTVITAIMVLGLFTVGTKPVDAEGMDEINKKLEELEKEQNEVDSQSDDINDKSDDTESKMNENVQQQEKVNNEIAQINRQLEQTEKELNTKEQEIEQTTKNIEQLKKDIAELKKRIAKREELLKNRIRALQQSGGDISYLEVLMGAQSFGDFLNRAAAVTTIMDQDKTIMETHRAEKQELETKQKDLVDKKQSLVKKKEELDTLKASLASQRKQKSDLVAQLKDKYEELEEFKMSLQEEQEILRGQEAAIKKAMEAAKNEKNRLEQLAAERERQKKEQQQSNGGSSPSSTPASGGNGLIGWPTSGYVTSPFGPRGAEYHQGIDIGNATARQGGDVPIRAVADGIVSRSYTSSSYGNVVFITHYLDGQIYTSVYAHMKYTPLVGNGATVKKGQQLGVMGATGNVTGPHLHFEFHRGQWNYAKSNAVNPYNYLP
ncbi:peptidoglycan DD-metalloendopeptidase family protein [Aquibacillus sp. 3ASR75-11]|uniref:Peptidoglycan DD-metalloendopeptidase family protein n=1 Tax=Terrihalobacillus insolitus TaxID=2950438 RepID=A0A9X3WSL2_9BACI|nr:peptidoglycan DD-metalloendopeptidase family protein [Terrihalobacillus insolitus]MDC3412245.1 peptidoglycan DD-metalloendopeptidase family protein [Terrihalobacillus insolitus]MDC3423061.1 peptidoglycan DD-metalloendopeptidase family protein [Terrihalobacillus insolitus]